jgi:anti-anti-sigma regulatory factor
MLNLLLYDSLRGSSGTVVVTVDLSALAFMDAVDGERLSQRIGIVWEEGVEKYLGT